MASPFVEQWNENSFEKQIAAQNQAMGDPYDHNPDMPQRQQRYAAPGYSLPFGDEQSIGFPMPPVGGGGTGPALPQERPQQQQQQAIPYAVPGTLMAGFRVVPEGEDPEQVRNEMGNKGLLVAPEDIQKNRRVAEDNLIRMGDSGLLSPLSDQYGFYQKAKADRAQEMQNSGASLEQMLGQTKLTQPEVNQLAQLQQSMNEINQRVMSGRLTPQDGQRMMGLIERPMDQLMRRNSMSIAINDQILQKKRMDEVAQVKAMEQANAASDAATFQQRFFTQKLPDGTTINGYMHTDGKPHFFPAGQAKGGAAEKVVPFDSTMQLEEAKAEAKVELAKAGTLYTPEGKEDLAAVMKRAAERYDLRRAQHEAGQKANAERAAGGMPAGPQGQQQGPPQQVDPTKTAMLERLKNIKQNAFAGWSNEDATTLSSHADYLAGFIERYGSINDPAIPPVVQRQLRESYQKIKELEAKPRK